jgi:hypothetical protein
MFYNLFLLKRPHTPCHIALKQSMTSGVLSTAQNTAVVVRHVPTMKDIYRWQRVLSQAPEENSYL